MDTVVQIVCPACRAKNRVPSARLGDRPVCGRCRAHLFGERPVSLDESSFDRYVSENALPVLVDFWAPWCGPCRAMAPAFEQAARTLAPRVLLAKVDTEAAPRLAARFGIQAIPTLVLFDGGREIARQSGALNAAQIAGWVAEAQRTALH